jgi:hypothetical protein
MELAGVSQALVNPIKIKNKMRERRGGYAFTVDERINVRTNAQGKCEFPGEKCERQNTGIVNHLTGCYEARLDEKTKESISDPNLNAIMLCNLHSILHDIQENYQVENLIWEKQHKKKRKL